MGTFIPEQTACVTGRRPKSIPGYWSRLLVRGQLRDKLLSAITMAHMQGYDTFISGMALGVDQEFFKQAVFVRDENRQPIRVVAAVPCLDQERLWPQPAKFAYRQMLAQADEVITVTELPYSAHLMEVRNRWMIDRSGLVIAAWDDQPTGGTYRAMEYARKQSRDIWTIDLNTLGR